jgi:hypothetical protein
MGRNQKIKRCMKLFSCKVISWLKNIAEYFVAYYSAVGRAVKRIEGKDEK